MHYFFPNQVAHDISEFSANKFAIFIYDCSAPSTTNPKLLAQLSMHTSDVNCIDWAPKSNMILTCSADMNCYVWVEDSPNKWHHVIVQGGLKFSATVCKWSPDEKLLALGSVSGNLRICHYVGEYNWWAEKRLKDQTSAILSISWTLDSQFLSVGVADRFFRIFSIADFSPKPIFSLTSPNYGFASSISTNPKGNLILLYCDDSSITIFDISAVILLYILFFFVLYIIKLSRSI